jgi:hypothetical protein
MTAWFTQIMKVPHLTACETSVIRVTTSAFRLWFRGVIRMYPNSSYSTDVITFLQYLDVELIELKRRKGRIFELCCFFFRYFCGVGAQEDSCTATIYDLL